MDKARHVRVQRGQKLLRTLDDGDGNTHLHKVLRHFQTDKTAASQIWSTLSDGVLADIRAANAHYEQYEGKVQDAAQKVNDTYLKAFSEESGVQSYGEAADLLIAWYLKNNA